MIAGHIGCTPPSVHYPPALAGVTQRPSGRATHGNVDRTAVPLLPRALPGRPRIGLALPAGEARPVVLQYELKDARFHCANYRGETGAANTLTFIVEQSKLGNAFSQGLTGIMAPRTLATLATVLSSARDADAAVTLLNHEAIDMDRSAQLTLFVCDSRRALITSDGPIGTLSPAAPRVALDHLPAPIGAPE